MTIENYNDFVQSKRRAEVATGHQPGSLNENLFDFQEAIVGWAVRRGRAAIFADTGLGKTLMQLSWAHEVVSHTGGRVLVLAPLAVSEQTIEQGAQFGIEVKRVPHTGEMDSDGVWITNYERMDSIDFTELHGLVLDESSILKAHDGKTRQRIIDAAQGVPYRLSCTATPSPNRYKELIHYAGFLGVMDTGQALTRFFQRDSTQANNLTLYPHKEKEFFLWLHSWAIFIQRPSDLGYSDAGYDLPGLEVRYHEVKAKDMPAKADRDGQLQMIRDSALGLKDAATEKRESIDERVAKMMEIIACAPDDHFILWHDLEAERHAITKALEICLQGIDENNHNRWKRFLRKVFALEEGEIAEVGTRIPRSGPFHRLHMAIEQAVFNGQERFNNFEMFRNWLKIGSGHVEWVPGAKGGIVPLPKSISYAELPEEEMREFHQNMLAFLRGEHAAPYLWRHLDQDEAHDMIAAVLGEFER